MVETALVPPPPPRSMAPLKDLEETTVTPSTTSSAIASPTMMMNLFAASLPFDYAFVLNLEGRFLFRNPGLQRLGFHPEGFSSGGLLKEDSVMALELLVQKALASQETLQSQECVSFHQDDDSTAASTKRSTTALWDVTLFPMKEPDGRMVALGGLIQEQQTVKDTVVHQEEDEECKEAEPSHCCPEESRHQRTMSDAVRESEERHQTLFENMKQGVVYHAADGHTMAANQSALRILGLSMDQMLGKSPMHPQWRFIYEDGSTIPVQEYPAVVALSGKPVTNMILGIVVGDEAVHWVQLDAMPRFRLGDEGKPYQAYTIFTDITEAKQIERSLRRAKEKAEEADLLKSSFLATMSHEIRTPLNGIMGHLDLILSNGLDEESKEENMEGVQVAMNSGKLLLSIIQDILDLSKIEAGQLDMVHKPITIRDMMDNTMKLANAYCIQRKKEHLRLLQSIDDGIASQIYGDQFRVQQVLNNLLSNSIKFSESGEVAVTVRLGSADGMVQFCVRDTGKGIPGDRLDMIFEPFRQVDFSDTRTHGGTGLGLTICKKLVEIMGGHMWVVSSTKNECHGSRFYFTLPYKPAAPGSGTDLDLKKTIQIPPLPVTERPPLRCQRSGVVLLAEDDTVSRKVATRMLQKVGLKVLSARDGAEAVDLFEKHHGEIDLILMDVMMPKLSGLEATEKIREVEREGNFTETVPICALSAGAMKGDKEKGLEVGMNDYLYKPINRSQLLKTLETYLGPHEHGALKRPFVHTVNSPAATPQRQ
ncbi:Sensor protein kinase WalK (Fragment) [Seminavis robusta]|uniref:Sensor protein kinase WalK n=1 Tax=Seminavis robusta TaxID=568900 RepID=A0A9N8E2E2_9STRA